MRNQFLTLYRVFLLRVIDLDLLATDADPTRLTGQFATLFITLSFFFTIPGLIGLLGGGHVSMVAQWTIAHFFLETSLTLAGLVIILNWDAAFLDRRDLFVLAPLPVRPITLFAAKTAALFGAPALSLAAFNTFIGVIWPFFLINHDHGYLDTIRAWPAYFLSLAAGGTFLVLSMLGLQGLLATLLPRQLFLRLSAFVQAGLICLLLSVYFLGPSLESPSALTAPANQRVLAWLPAYWFLGLFEQLNGAQHPALAALARRAWIALATSLLAATAAILLAYKRPLTKTIEQPDILPRRPTAWTPSFGGNLQSAIALFSLRTLLRSRQHRMILSIYLGVGIAIVLGYIRTPWAGLAPTKSGIDTTFLLSSIVTVILTLLALRVVSAIPISLKAHWIIRLTGVRPASDYHRAVRISWLLIAVLPILTLLSAAFAFYPWQQVLGHILLMLFLAVLLMELCLTSFPKIPFTCSYLPGKANLHIVFWAALLIFIRVLKDAAEYESHLLRDLPSYLLAGTLLTAAGLAMHLYNTRRIRPTDDLVFEEEDAPEMISLKLT